MKSKKKKCFNLILYLTFITIPTIAIARPLIPIIPQPQSNPVFSSSSDDVSQLLNSLQHEPTSLFPQSTVTGTLRKIVNVVEKQSKHTGVNVGIEYIPLYQYSAQAIRYNRAAGGDFELFGQYQPWWYIDQSTTIGFKIIQRHSYTQISPNTFNQQINSIIKTTSGYRPINPSITELWVEQLLIPSKLIIRLGKLNLKSVMDTFIFDSKKFFFLSDVYSSEPAVAVPSRALGLIIGLKLIQNIYLSSTLVDANGQLETSGFNSFGKGQYFTAVELGYREIIQNPASDNYHIYLWHISARPEKSLASDQGITLVLQKRLYNEKLFPFFKASANRGRAQPVKALMLLGIGYHYPFGGQSGLLGIAGAYTKLSPYKTAFFNQFPSYDTMNYTTNLSNHKQLMLEMFYRVQLTPHSQLTPDLQIIQTLKSQNLRKAHWAIVPSLRFRIAV